MFILSIMSCQKEEPNNDAEAFKKVEQVVQGVFDNVWAAKNAEAISKYHTDDFIILEHGEVWTNETISNWCKEAKLRDEGTKRINTFDFFKAKKEGNRVWMAYHNYATFKKDTILGKMQWLESIVAVKQDSIWKLEMMHSTRIPK
ncbi:nuclear transport factor 2 family protein [Bizionia argentinensis JUB59]|uniref:Nuclear transport factor 2 family protein n=2 Tax=Bizionia TaxID=283785 RepID=G2ED06_9FLAO|nr:nuclear transport factor 2 family protein [Bizionia argentinensis JUB59]